MLLRFAGGARGAVTVSQVSAGRKNHAALRDRRRRRARWPGTRERPEELWIGHRGRPNELLLQGPGAAGARGAPPQPPTRAGTPRASPTRSSELYRRVYRAVEAGGPPDAPDYPTFADGHDEALIGEAIAASARDGALGDHRREDGHGAP